MAKGNDGNYLQSSVEIAAAVQLASIDAAHRLHIALTHGMAPFESTDETPNPPARSLLLRALNDSYRPRTANEPSIVTAYRKANASLTRYPNSAELLRHAVGVDRLSGGITEVDKGKHALLEQAWSGSRVVPVNSSWRSETESGGALACPAILETPWLLTLDPMTYREEGCVDDANLYRADLERLTSLLKPYIASDRPGMAAVFVYAIKPDDRPQVWRFVNDLASAVGTGLLCCWVTHRGGSRNLAGLLCSGLNCLADDLPDGLTPGRD